MLRKCGVLTVWKGYDGMECGINDSVGWVKV